MGFFYVQQVRRKRIPAAGLSGLGAAYCCPSNLLGLDFSLAVTRTVEELQRFPRKSESEHAKAEAGNRDARNLLYYWYCTKQRRS